MPLPVKIIQTGEVPDYVLNIAGDMERWFGNALGNDIEDIQTIRAYAGEALPALEGEFLVILTGSAAMVTERAAWSVALAAWLRDAVSAGFPIFGVCYGHQILADALGGEVDYHPSGREIGCQKIKLASAASDDLLLEGFPQDFAAHLTHVQTVTRLPEGCTVLAASEHDPHQILRYAPNVVSVQFHPEYTPAISKAVIDMRRTNLEAEGFDIEALLADLEKAEWAAILMRRFVDTAARIKRDN